MKKFLVGIDEVGRGPLAGPVYVCACMAHKDFDYDLLEGIKDSKKLTEKKREEWCEMLMGLSVKSQASNKNVKHSVFNKLIFEKAYVSAAVIDKIGIAGAIRLCIKRVLERLPCDERSAHILLDGALRAPSPYASQETITKGDESEPLIAAASIVAKVTRDRVMVRLAKGFPDYDFHIHKGYGTKSHCKTIKHLGPTPQHRKTFCQNLL